MAVALCKAVSALSELVTEALSPCEFIDVVVENLRVAPSEGRSVPEILIL